MTTSPRIISLLPSATEIVCALGLESALVGITHECDYPTSVAHLPRLTASRIDHARLSSRDIDHAVRSQLDGHGSIYDLDEPQLRSLKPDLILTQELCEVCAVSYRTVQQATRLFTTDVTVVSLEPSTISDIFATIASVAELCGVAARGMRLVAALQARLDALAARVATASSRPPTLMLEWLEPPFAPGHWVPEQVALAGGIAVLGAAGAKSVTTTAAAITAAAPELAVLIPCGYTASEILAALATAELPAGWLDLPAVRRDNVWAVDASAFFSRPGPRVVDGAEILAHLLHPEIVGPPSAAQAMRVPRERMRSAAL